MADRHLRRPRPRSLNAQDWLLHADDHLLVLNKPKGLACLAEHQPGPNLLDLLRTQLDPNAQLAHRLDKHTTGLLLAARTPEAYRHLALQFQERQVAKTYWALAWGDAFADETSIEFPLAVGGNGKTRVDFDRGKPATTTVRSLEAWRVGHWVEARPLQGRQHQIRVHLANVARPIIGDAAYGSIDLLMRNLKHGYRGKPEQADRPLNDGLMLHAHALQLLHPATGQSLQLQAPAPANFSLCIDLLRKHAGR